MTTRVGLDAVGAAVVPRRIALAIAVVLAALAVVIGTAVAGPAEAASAAVAIGKPDKPGKPGGGGGNGGGTTELELAALGDSFAAGVGAGSYLETSCYTSSKSYPVLLDGDADKRLAAFPACSGKDTGDVINRQIAAVPTTAKLVTVTVGGNDVGFADVMQSCFVLPSSSCSSNIANGAATAASPEFTSSIVAVVDGIQARAPEAKVIVTGYPLLFWENSSGVNPKYAWADEVNDETVVLNDVIEAAATSAGAVFVDVEDDFAGHGIGSSSPWINDWKWLTTRTVNAFHPNATGHAAYAAAIRAVPPA
ncbi:SGNH/GDSL hydrolase family protein [Agromyces binzhouensis]|uniref:SGNH/GDSL hydrolase family protein n=1 Tax=Agromyces binzhouensis TaxID=1817495 RepID=A0A4Q2JXU1_9MICO|nr:SGNH/GDSL hydrolase family protein [Agromyces binzhouensis]RXZ51609.1 SGNH/GDSL hydrolase family protein [Agromyces binzhouensis]